MKVGIALSPDIDQIMDLEWYNGFNAFGHINFYMGEDGKVHIDSEYMGREFVKRVVNQLIDEAMFDNEDIHK